MIVTCVKVEESDFGFDRMKILKDVKKGLKPN